MLKRTILKLLILVVLGGAAAAFVPTQYYPAQLQIYPQIVAPAGITVDSLTRDSLFSRLDERMGESHVFLRFTGQAKSGQTAAQLLTEFERPIVEQGWSRQELSLDQWLTQYMEQLPTPQASGVDNNRLRLILCAIIAKGQLQHFVKGMTADEVKLLVADDLKEDVTQQSVAELHLALEMLPGSPLGRNFNGASNEKIKILQLFSRNDLQIVVCKSPTVQGLRASCYAVTFSDEGKVHLAVSAETLK